MSNWLGFDRGISQAISDWAQLSGVLTDCWWRQRQRERERLEDKSRENCKGKKKSINSKFVSDPWLSIWYMAGLHSHYMVFCFWCYVFEYSVYPNWSAMFWLDWRPYRQLKQLCWSCPKLWDNFLLNNDLKSHYRVFKTFLILLRDENE